MDDIPPPDRPANELAAMLRNADKNLHDGGKTIPGAAAALGRLETATMLTLSTCHVPEVVCDDLNGFDGVVATKGKYGWFVWVPSDICSPSYPMENTLPPEPVFEILKFARRQACDWVRLDSDGPEILDLPAWRW